MFSHTGEFVKLKWLWTWMVILVWTCILSFQSYSVCWKTAWLQNPFWWINSRKCWCLYLLRILKKSSLFCNGLIILPARDFSPRRCLGFRGLSRDCESVLYKLTKYKVMNIKLLLWLCITIFIAMRYILGCPLKGEDSHVTALQTVNFTKRV